MRTFWTDFLSAAASAALTIGIVAFATPAAANTTLGDTPRAVVTFQQADTATAAGRATIERHIRMAAENVCQTGDAGQQIAESRCRSEAIAHAEHDLDARSTQVIQVAAR
jgi:UrcA family protein